MKTQLIGVIFSVLLCSHIGHAYLHAKEVHEHSRIHLSRGLHSHNKHHAQSKSVSAAASGNVRVVINASAGLALLVNESANVAVIVDIKLQLVLLIDANNAVGVLIDLVAGTAALLQASQCAVVKQCAASLKDALTIVLAVGLSVVASATIGIKVALNAVNNQVLSTLTIIATGLGGVNVTSSTVVNLLCPLLSSLISSLTTILVIAGANVNVVIGGSLVLVVNILAAVSRIASGVVGGVAALVAAKVVLDLAAILSAASGVARLTLIITAIVAKVSASILGPLISTTECVVQCLADLGGNVLDGTINGLLTALSLIIQVAGGTISAASLINSLIPICNAVVQRAAALEIQAALQALLVAVSISNSVVQPIQALINGIISNNLTIAGVAVGQIILLLTGGASSALDLVVKILIVLPNIISLKVSVPILLGIIVGGSVSITSQSIASLLLPTVQIGSGLLSSILGLTTGLYGGILGTLSTIPQLSLAISALSSSMINAGISQSLSAIISGSAVSSALTSLVWGNPASLLNIISGGQCQAGAGINFGTSVVVNSGWSFNWGI